MPSPIPIPDASQGDSSTVPSDAEIRRAIKKLMKKNIADLGSSTCKKYYDALSVKFGEYNVNQRKEFIRRSIVKIYNKVHHDKHDMAEKVMGVVEAKSPPKSKLIDEGRGGKDFVETQHKDDSSLNTFNSSGAIAGSSLEDNTGTSVSNRNNLKKKHSEHKNSASSSKQEPPKPTPKSSKKRKIDNDKSSGPEGGKGQESMFSKPAGTDIILSLCDEKYKQILTKIFQSLGPVKDNIRETEEAEKIFNELKSTGGRFFKQNRLTKKCYLVNDGEALKKIREDIRRRNESSHWKIGTSGCHKKHPKTPTKKDKTSSKNGNITPHIENQKKVAKSSIKTDPLIYVGNYVANLLQRDGWKCTEEKVNRYCFDWVTYRKGCDKKTAKEGVDKFTGYAALAEYAYDSGFFKSDVVETEEGMEILDKLCIAENPFSIFGLRRKHPPTYEEGAGHLAEARATESTAQSKNSMDATLGYLESDQSQILTHQRSQSISLEPSMQPSQQETSPTLRPILPSHGHEQTPALPSHTHYEEEAIASKYTGGSCNVVDATLPRPGSSEFPHNIADDEHEDNIDDHAIVRIKRESVTEDNSQVDVGSGEGYDHRSNISVGNTSVVASTSGRTNNIEHSSNRSVKSEQSGIENAYNFGVARSAPNISNTLILTNSPEYDGMVQYQDVFKRIMDKFRLAKANTGKYAKHREHFYGHLKRWFGAKAQKHEFQLRFDYPTIQDFMARFDSTMDELNKSDDDNDAIIFWERCIALIIKECQDQLFIDEA